MTTRAKTEITATWQQVSAGPAFLYLHGYRNVYIAVGTSVPAIDDDAYITLTRADRTLNWNGTDNVYARTDPGVVENLVVWAP